MRSQLFTLGLAALLAMPATAAAQRRMPHGNADGVGAEVGLFVPHQDGMTSGPEIDGFFEHYLTPRDSVRGVVGWANPKVDRANDHSTRQIRVGGEFIHNWEGGAVHPFLGAGLGVYFLQPRVAGSDVGDGATRFGGTLLGGAEYFVSKTISVKGEGRYNVVSKWNAYDPSGLALTIGVKSYF